MAFKFNPFTGTFDYVDSGTTSFLPPVDTEADLPLNDPDGAVRVVLETDRLYVFQASDSKWFDTGVIAEYSDVSHPAGLSASLTTDGDIIRPTLNLHAADESNPGALTADAQNIGGDKSFQGKILVGDSIDVAAGQNTLSIGVADAEFINIGSPAAIINVQGDTFYQNVTDLNVTDKHITVNKDGSAGSGSDAGIHVEENAVVAGYVTVSADRNAWELKAPNTAGAARLVPGTSGIVLDQSSHNPVTLGANPGPLVLNNQELDFTDTDDIPEGTTNLFYTDERAQDAIGTILVDSSSIDFTYADATPSITAVVLPAGVDHDALQNYVANEHIDHTFIEIQTPAGSGLVGGGNIAQTRALSIDITETDPETSIADNDLLHIWDVSVDELRSMTRSNFFSGYVKGSPGDIKETSFSGSATPTPADVTGLVFTSRSFEAQVNVISSGNYETFFLKGTKKAADWNLAYESSGDDTNVAFSVNSSGQIQYISSGAVDLKFRATTLSA